MVDTVLYRMFSMCYWQILSLLIDTDVFRYSYTQLIHMYKQLYTTISKTFDINILNFFDWLKRMIILQKVIHKIVVCAACSNRLRTHWERLGRSTINSDEKKQIDILIYTYDNRWTYVNIYVYTNKKKSMEIIIVYYVFVAKYVYIDVKNSVEIYENSFICVIQWFKSVGYINIRGSV